MHLMSTNICYFMRITRHWTDFFSSNVDENNKLYHENIVCALFVDCTIQYFALLWKLCKWNSSTFTLTYYDYLWTLEIHFGKLWWNIYIKLHMRFVLRDNAFAAMSAWTLKYGIFNFFVRKFLTSYSLTALAMIWGKCN